MKIEQDDHPEHQGDSVVASEKITGHGLDHELHLLEKNGLLAASSGLKDGDGADDTSCRDKAAHTSRSTGSNRCMCKI